MFVPTSTTSRGARARAVMARNEATSGSLMGWPCSAANFSMRAKSGSRAGSRPSRYAACSGCRMASDECFTDAFLLLLLVLLLHHVVLHRRELVEELFLVVLADLLFLESERKVLDEGVPLALGHAHPLMSFLHGLARVRAAPSGHRADLVGEHLLEVVELGPRLLAERL